MLSTEPRRSSVRIIPTVGIASAVFFAGTIVTELSVTADHHDVYPRTRMVMSESADRAKSATASDWLARADHVVVATAIGEEARPPAQSEVERGEGLIMRDVRFRVDDVLWSTQRLRPPPAPTEFNWLALGWLFKGGTVLTKTEMTGAHEPRFEVGHTYIMALEWELSTCAGTSTDGDMTGSWRGLGSGALLPYDDGRIGNGEFEGTDGAVAAAKREWAEHGATLATELAGTPSAELEETLEAQTEQNAIPGGDGVTC